MSLVYREDMDGIGSQVRREKVVVGGIEYDLVRVRRFLGGIWSAALKSDCLQRLIVAFERKSKSLDGCRSTSKT